MYIAVGILAVVVIAAVAILQHPAFGALPSGERMERIKQSKNYRDGSFRNLEITPANTSNENIVVQMWNFLFNRPKDITPSEPVKAIKTDLNQLDLSENQVVWFGHSSYMLVVGGKKILVDPVLTSEFPASWMMTPFKGADLYTPEDIPAVDCLIITHDHWDHLDYGTLKQIKDRVAHVATPLGVGAHLEKWGYGDKLTEMDWNDSALVGDVKLTCLPGRHYSSRLLKRCQSLWASFMVQTGGKTIFVGGDSGYGKHFAEIARQFPNIDLAMIEDGQYGKGWSKIHTMPEELASVIKTINARTTVPVHNGKFALANHSWDEPVRTAEQIAKSDSTRHIVLPTIGKPIAIE